MDLVGAVVVEFGLIGFVECKMRSLVCRVGDERIDG